MIMLIFCNHFFQIHSTIKLTASAPPKQREAIPLFAPLSFMAYSKVVRTLAPLAPIGWPRATAPPRTLTLVLSIPKALTTAIVVAEKASLILKRSISFRERSAFFRAFGID